MTGHRRTGQHVTPRMLDAAISAAKGSGLSDRQVKDGVVNRVQNNTRPAGLSDRQAQGLDRAVSAAKERSPK